jgi:hypothetical protein
MTGSDIFTLGLGIEAPWRIVDQHLDTGKKPHELRVELAVSVVVGFPVRSVEPFARRMISASIPGVT